MIEALDIWVKGIVQGVGFRPFVYRLAKRYLINGWVKNAIDGVHIHAEGEEKLLDEFVMELSDNAPAASQVKEIELKEVPLEPFDTFEILASDDDDSEETTMVSPDLATCSDCIDELFDPTNPRYRYPFINCTNCGPRFTIINELPYDRKNTSMRDFRMCKMCQHEYDDPADRRFHAQPNACFEDGPVLALWNAGDEKCAVEGTTRELSDEIISRAVEMILDGKILAVKGLGGFHLVCDANNPSAIERLRERKHRFGKPLAVMMQNVADVERVCLVNDAERKQLEGSVRPIVLLRKRYDAHFANYLADKLPELGVMLPYTPVQHLLLHDFAEAWKQEQKHHSDQSESAEQNGSSTIFSNPPMLVMTSGNLHDEPIVISNDEAVRELSKIADALILNNRDIVARFDDSVLRVINVGDDIDAIQFIRRSRGYAPAPIIVKGCGNCASTIFAVGSEQKNTFAFIDGKSSSDKANQASPEMVAIVSQHIGDMENAETFDAWLEAKKRYEKLFDLEAQVIACDMHPEYLASKWAREMIADSDDGLPLVETQHHHAHIVSVMAENSLSDAICGIAFDGTGYGADGNIWGGEVLISNLQAYERFINFAYVPMPGGAAAIKDPKRMAYGVLSNYDLIDHDAAKNILNSIGKDQVQAMETMIEQGINTPVTSSAGRLFDAASAILGLSDIAAYEGEPAILLEAALWDEIQNAQTSNDDTLQGEPYEIAVIKNVATDNSTAQDTSVLLFDVEPLFKALLDDIQSGIPVGIISRKFHDAFVGAIVQAAQFAEALYGIKTVALTGGVFMNRYMIEHSIAALQDAGFTVAINRELPPNDGCISLGQSTIAANLL